MIPQVSIDPSAVDMLDPLLSVPAGAGIAVVAESYASIETVEEASVGTELEIAMGPLAATTAAKSSFGRGAGMKLEMEGGPL